jgi:phosphoribosyl 1,2-cyclic phosphate phosphodiesterase
MKVTMLGCGSSIGVPSLYSGWGLCDPNEPRNRRRRCSILVEYGGPTEQGGPADQAEQVILVDASPDLREQLIDAEVARIDALLITHFHADHTHGLDDLRPVQWRMGRPIDMMADAPTLQDLGERFGYMMAFSDRSPEHFRPPLIAHEIPRNGTIEAAGMPIDVMLQSHGGSGESLGFVFDGRFAYSTDVHSFTEAQLEQLAGYELDLWIVDCLRFEPSTAHADFETTMAWIERVRPKRAVLTHMNTQMDYRTVLERCPDGVEPGYDGLVLTL